MWNLSIVHDESSFFETRKQIFEEIKNMEEKFEHMV